MALPDFTDIAQAADSSLYKTAIDETAALHEAKLSDLINLIYPIGAIFISTQNVNPSSLIGGTWTAMQTGRVLISENASYPAGSTGGSKDAVNISHTHTFNGTALPGHTHTIGYAAEIGGNFVTRAGSVLAGNIDAGMSSVSAGTPAGTNSDSGVSGTDKNMQPYLAVYMWERAE